MEIVLYLLIVSNIVSLYTIYKLYSLLKIEKRVSAGIKSALTSLIKEKQQSKTTRKKK
jgi:hypothetical protein